MAAYRSAARLFPGCHVASLCIGMEYLRTNNLNTAAVAFNDTLNINSRDPMVYNELGVVHYKDKQFDTSKKYLE
jgi:anaphase-promoting complex subunit 6